MEIFALAKIKIIFYKVLGIKGNVKDEKYWYKLKKKIVNWNKTEVPEREPSRHKDWNITEMFFQRSQWRMD